LIIADAPEFENSTTEVRQGRMLRHKDQLFESCACCPAGYRLDEKYNRSRVAVLVVGGGPDGHYAQPLGRFGFVSGKNYCAVGVFKQFCEPPEVLDFPRTFRMKNIRVNGSFEGGQVGRVNGP